jgi:aryl-alcohol dehydrogenase-like predicted oxidoreductase
MVEDIGRLLAEEAEAAEEHRDDDVPLVRSRRPAKEPAQVYNLRIPVEKLEELRRLAEERHLTPSALMRSWVLERLEQESSS